MKSNRFANTGFLSLVLATLIFLVALFAFKLSIDEYNAQKQHPTTEHHAENEVARERAILGVGAEGWTAIFTGGLLVFTMALAVFTYRLFRVTKDGIAEQAAMTRESLDHASRSARAAERAIEAANLSSQTQLRAYVGITEAGVALETDQKGINGRIRITLINTGNTPAFGIQGYIGVQYGHDFDSSVEPEIITGGIYIFPGESQKLLSKKYRIDVPFEGFEYFIFGRVEYVDTFRKKHVTSFRMIIAKFNLESSSATLGACAEGNEAD